MAATLVFRVAPAVGGIASSSPPASEVVAYPPDGGSDVNIISAIRLDSNITNQWIPVAGSPEGAKLEIDATVTNTPAVTISGVPVVALQNGTIVNLTAETYALLAGDRACTDYPVGHNTVGGTVFEFPTFAGQQTASIGIHNCGAAVDYVSCFRSSFQDGGPPPTCTIDSTSASIPIHNGETWVVDGLTDTQRLRCVACTHAGPPSGGTCLAGGAVSTCIPSP